MKTYYKAIKVNDTIIYSPELQEKELASFIESKESTLFDDEGNSFLYIEDGAIYLYEWKKYKVRAVNNKVFSEEMFSGIGEYGNETFGFIKFKNSVGIAFVGDVQVHVVSKKITEKENDLMIETVNHYISNLSYDFNQSTYSNITRNKHRRTDLQYHIYLMVLNALRTRDRATNIFSNYEIIKNNPHRKLYSEDVYVDYESVNDFSNVDFSEIVAGESALSRSITDNKISKKIRKDGRGFIPSEMKQTQVDISIDNNENRFVKFFMNYCLGLLEEFQDYFIKKDDLINKKLIEDNAYFIGKIKNELNNSFLQQVGDMRVLPISSTVLTKRDGYRQLFGFFLGIKSIPQNIHENDVKEIIENKSLDVLYENFCFFIMANILCDIYGESIDRKKFRVAIDGFSKTLIKQSYSNYFEFPSINGLPKIRLHYNKNYSPDNNRETYSKNYDPDIALEIFDKKGIIEKIYLFDSKFKANVFSASDEDDVSAVKLYKWDDISKMHAYKDAIRNAVGAYILYPGTVKSIFEEEPESNIKLKGVGAFCLRPANDEDCEVIKDMLTNILK